MGLANTEITEADFSVETNWIAQDINHSGKRNEPYNIGHTYHFDVITDE